MLHYKQNMDGIVLYVTAMEMIQMQGVQMEKLRIVMDKENVGLSHGLVMDILTVLIKLMVLI